jgi:endonuclease/exonuclease/phosphatase (EEP) superfamily protein YafD
VLSRYPLENEALLLTYEDIRGDLKNGLMRVEADIDGITVVIFVAHPPPPSFVTLETPPVFYDEQLRDDQLQTLKDHVIQESYPVLALCDCNVTDQNTGYQILDSVLDDSFQEAGRGLGFTVAPQPMSIPAIFPLLWRIDYVWHDAAFVVSDAWVMEEDGTSDHRAVLAQMHLLTPRGKL